MTIRIGVLSLGCAKNSVDAEQLQAKLDAQPDFALTDDLDSADVILVNTCGFIESAKKESISWILDLSTLKEQGNLRCLVVTGCLAQRYQSELAEAFPEVDAVVGMGGYAEIAQTIRKALSQPQPVLSFGSQEALDLNSPRVFTHPRHFAYLKIAEGCNNACSFCAIPAIRGRYRSRPLSALYREAEWLAQQGVKELILVAQDTTRYGEDLYKEPALPQLLSELAQLDFVWIRLLYCYPERISTPLLETMAAHTNILPYLDLPIQHIHDGLLKRMNRHTSRVEILQTIAHIRKHLPQSTLRTTLIAGFPGETEEAFEELMEFVQSARFDRLGCFAYSQEQGTPAATMQPQLPEEVRSRRAELILLAQQRILEEKNQALVGTILPVLIDEKQGEHLYSARTMADAPEVDCGVQLYSQQELKPGALVSMQVNRTENTDLIGQHTEPCTS